MEKKRNEQILSSKLFFMILVALLVILTWKFIDVSLQMIGSQSAITALHTNLEVLQERQVALKKMEGFIQSDYFTEREARLKYGLQKKGELAVIIQEKENTIKPNMISVGEIGKSNQRAHLSTRWQWWYYFFENQQ